MNAQANNNGAENQQAAAAEQVADAAAKAATESTKTFSHFFDDIRQKNDKTSFFTPKKIAVGLGVIAGAAAAWYFRDSIKGVVGGAATAVSTTAEVATDVATSVAPV